MDLLGAPRRKGPAQEGADLSLAHIELLGQDAGVVSVPRKPGLQPVGWNKRSGSTIPPFTAPTGNMEQPKPSRQPNR